MLKEQIVAEIMKLVRPAMIPMDHKPTIDEIEKMLNSDNPKRISIAPDGSAVMEAPSHTVGDIADAVLRIVGDVRAATLREAMGKVQADCAVCGGSGHAHDSTPDDPMQCEYCGRPNSAIHELLTTTNT
ncbi:MAG TPA: hypothetical protein VGG45_16385 [Terracidiphilus sp.]|jgi:hypothetical protein